MAVYITFIFVWMLINITFWTQVMFEEFYAKWEDSDIEAERCFFAVCMVERLRHYVDDLPVVAEDSSISVHKLYSLLPPGDTELCTWIPS